MSYLDSCDINEQINTSSEYDPLSPTPSKRQRIDDMHPVNSGETSNQGVIGLLHQILQSHNTMNDRITKIERTLHENNIYREEMRAQNILMRECKSLIQNIEPVVCADVEPDIKFPIDSEEALLAIEEKLKEKEYARSVLAYFHKLKGVSEDVVKFIRIIFTDELLLSYNWDGRCGRKALSKLIIMDEFVFRVFEAKGRVQLEKDCRKAVELSHNRVKHRKSAVKRNALYNSMYID